MGVTERPLDAGKWTIVPRVLTEITYLTFLRLVNRLILRLVDEHGGPNFIVTLAKWTKELNQAFITSSKLATVKFREHFQKFSGGFKRTTNALELSSKAFIKHNFVNWNIPVEII